MNFGKNQGEGVRYTAKGNPLCVLLLLCGCFKPTQGLTFAQLHVRYYVFVFVPYQASF